MWYIVTTSSGKPKAMYATKPPVSEGDVISAYENYHDAKWKLDDLRREADERKTGLP